MNRTWALTVWIASAGCITGSPDTLAGAATVTAAAIGAAIAERQAGGCIAVCTNDTICNPRNGLCEVLPCRNECAADQHCEETLTGAACAAGSVNSVSASARGNRANLPIAPAVAPAPAGSPTVVPAAEQGQR